MASTILPPINGCLLSPPSSSFPAQHRSATIPKWQWKRDQDASLVSSRTRGQAFQILANSNVSSGKGGSNKDVIMVDPVEAKRLAAKQMARIKAREKLKRRRQIEAINGAWAMIGLTAGLVIEGQTGKSILMQLHDPWTASCMICKMGPDIELKRKMESAPGIHFCEEIVPAPPFSEQKVFQPAISECNACATEALPIEKTPLSNGNEDVEVNITGSSNSGKILVVEVASEDVTEYSSSFCDSLSGTENENCSAFSDVEVQSQINSGNASSPIQSDCFGLFPMRKKKLTDHWRRFIHPLMWRCKWIELQLKLLQSQAFKYDKELQIYDRRKQHEFTNFTLDGFGTESIPFTGSAGRNKVMKRKKRKRVEAECDLASYMFNHRLFSYYENKSSVDVAHLKDAPGVATGNAVDTEEFRRNDILSSLESKDSDKSLEDIILKIEAVHEQVHRLKTRVDTVISENPGKFTSVNKLSTHEPSDRLNDSERYPTSSASDRSKNTFPVRSVKTEFNMEDLLMPGNGVSSCVEMSPLIEITSKPQHEVLWDTKDGVLVQNQVAKEELQTFENVRNKLVKTMDEPGEERKSIPLVHVSEPDSATKIAATHLQPASVQACSSSKSSNSRNRRRRKKKTR